MKILESKLRDLIKTVEDYDKNNEDLIEAAREAVKADTELLMVDELLDELDRERIIRNAELKINDYKALFPRKPMYVYLGKYEWITLMRSMEHPLPTSLTDVPIIKVEADSHIGVGG